MEEGQTQPSARRRRRRGLPQVGGLQAEAVERKQQDAQVCVCICVCMCVCVCVCWGNRVGLREVL